MSANHTPENQTIALAGIFQSTSLCKNLATFGRCDQDHLSSSLSSILKTDSNSVLDVFGDTNSIKHGLRILKTQLNPAHRERDIDLARYAIALIQLGDSMLKHDNTMNQIQQGIEHGKTLEFAITDATLINNLAELYRNNISHLSPRIMISGEPRHLNNEFVAAQIRACLLAGLRSVVLWRQCKGTRPGLIFNRGKYLRISERMLAAI